jgi:hypothetical protein
MTLIDRWPVLSLRRIADAGYRYRLVLCGHKAAEVGGACLLLMVQGEVTHLTFLHFAIATKTGILAMSPALVLTFTRHARHLANRWSSSAILAACGFVADAVSHGSHYPGAYTEAALTASGGFVLSLLVSYTPVGRHLDHLAERFLEERAAKTRPPAQSIVGA